MSERAYAIGTLVRVDGETYEITEPIPDTIHDELPNDGISACYLSNFSDTRVPDILYKEEIEEVISTPPPQEPALDDRDVWNLAAARFAIEHKGVVWFAYQKPDGSVTKRKVRPHFIKNTNRSVVIVGKTGVDEIRAFRLDRIVGHVRVSNDA